MPFLALNISLLEMLRFPIGGLDPGGLEELSIYPQEPI